MSRLILLNGPPAVGKSTLAARYARDHNGVAVIELDELRSINPGWESDPHAAGVAARREALGLIRHLLADGRDVVVPQYLGRDSFIGQLEEVAADAGSLFVEVVLMAGFDDVAHRFEARTKLGTSPAGVDALVEAAGGRAHLREQYDRLVKLSNRRREVVLIATSDGDIDAAYDALCAVLGDP